MEIKDKIDRNKLPQHVAVIMDGNGRWAKKKGNQRIFGHQNGVKAVRETVEAAAELGIKFLTLYAFSTENWKRPQNEVNALMHLLISTLNSEVKTLQENNVRLLAIGDLESLPANVHHQLRNTIDLTSTNSGLSLVLALSYSGRWELVHAVKNIIQDANEGKITPDKLNENTLYQYMQSSFMPYPELLIRTSGEYRISNFLLWQIAYTELYFTPILWPDFRKENFFEAILDFQKRERRFGKTSDQLVNETSTVPNNNS
ncbi:MAG: isoprenyl transferase [Bacteroidales bacterium]|nr:isoprenyl transferase [Bacteroidales bacterium]